MKNFNRLAGGLVLLVLVVLPSKLFSQTVHEIGFSDSKNKGISVELFVGVEHTSLNTNVLYKENLSPYLNLAVGKQLTPFLTLALGYHGPYYNYIGDPGKHNYFLIDVSAILEANNLFKFWQDKRVRLNVQLGTGVMGNMAAKKANFCLTGAFVPEIKLNSNYSLKMKIGGIGGWGIYQENRDALVTMSLGLTRYF